MTEYEKLREEHKQLWERWSQLEASRHGTKETPQVVLDQLQDLSDQMHAIRDQMRFVEPVILLSWYDILPHLPVIDVDDNIIIRASLSKSIKHSPDREEYIEFHYIRPDLTTYKRSCPNRRSALANTWAVYVKRKEAKRIGINQGYPRETNCYRDDRPAARNSVQFIIYEGEEKC